VSVEKSEYLSTMLRKRGVPHEVLNAKYHEREAAIVAQAGRKGAVTVATNMAGRGTDIQLGGNPDDMAMASLAQRGLTPEETPEEYQAALPEALDSAKRKLTAEHNEVLELGGLYVLGTERHESRRIDNQLRGRAGRQGDPGETRFYLSLGDDLMRMFKAGMVERVLAMANVPKDVPIEHKMVTRAIASAQTQIEQQNFEIRKNVLKYDEVLNRQRLVVYAERRKVLEGADLATQVRLMMDDTIGAYVEAATAEGYAEEWDLDKLWTALHTLYPVSVTVEEIEDAAGGRDRLSREILVEELTADIRQRYSSREEQLGEQITRELERRVVLSVLDRKWREHLYEMDYLQEGIGLRAMAQRDPLVEYQREGFDMFTAMMEALKEESVGYLFNLQVEVEAVNQDAASQAQAAATQDALQVPAPVQDAIPAGYQPELRAKGLETPRRPDHLNYSAPTIDGEGGVIERSESYADYRGGDESGYTSAGDEPAPRSRRGSGKRKKR
jgi:preprotein translocase subunit SecA